MFFSYFCFLYFFYIFRTSTNCNIFCQNVQECYIERVKKFIKINEEFICKKCGHKNPKLEGGCRNHCKKCLCSLHLDKESPGDRLSSCKNLMLPISIHQNGKKGWIITHKCEKCGKKIPNKAAPDDNFEKIIILSAPK